MEPKGPFGSILEPNMTSGAMLEPKGDFGSKMDPNMRVGSILEPNVFTFGSKVDPKD